MVREISPTLDTMGNAYDTDRVVTLPNILSVMRLLGIPLFLWLLLAERNELAAVAVLAVASLTDFLDGLAARRLSLRSPVGRVLDPLVDRAYIVTTLIGLALREIVPWWLVAVLFARDAILGMLWIVFRSARVGDQPVHIVGKAGTFALLVAIPSLLLGATAWQGASLFTSLGWILACLGTVLYWSAGVIYVRHTKIMVSAARSNVT